MGRNRRKRPHPFSPSEIEQMEEFLGAKEEAHDKDFCVRLTEKMNHASGRVGKKALQWKQVQRWLQCKQKDSAKRTVSFDIVAKELVSIPKSCMPNGHEKSEGEDSPRVIELEARSSRDGAWYDVDEIISHKVSDCGELEALVRYKDFGPDEDEWLNVKKAVRERSVPIESNKCHIVAVGDLVICFRERDEGACYFEACIMDIQRKLHDVRGCRCRFLVQYTHDQTQETVRLQRICRRP